MNILFLCSGGNSCRCLMAKKIMESLNSELDIFAAGLSPVTEIAPHAQSVMEEIGIVLDVSDIHSAKELKDKYFDYLITLCEGTREDYKMLQLQYNHKLHLGFDNPETPRHKFADKQEAYRYLRDELKTELHYFYYRILTKKTAR